jgi:RNA polymerase sigma-70 factor (ECF subfamily)
MKTVLIEHERETMKRKHMEEQLPVLQVKLLKYAYRLTWDRYRADDLLQETLIRMLCNADSFNGCSRQFTKWAYTIMYNAFINSVKKEEHAHAANDMFYSTSFASKDSEQYHSDERLMIKDIYNAINNLPDNACKVMHLYIIGHKYVEIATSLKIPIGTVKAHINRAKIILKEQLKDYLC